MAGMAWQTTQVAGTYEMPVPIIAIKTFQQSLVGQKQKDQTCILVKKPCIALYKLQLKIINKSSQHEHVHELWQGWLGRLHMSPKHIKMPVPINATKTFQQPLVGQKQEDQTHRLVTNPCRSMAQKRD